MLWFVSGVAACTHPWNCETMDVCDCIYHKCLQRPQTPPRLGWPWNCLQHVGSLSWFYALRSFFGLSFGLKVYPIRFCAKDQRCGSTFDAAIRSRPPIISSLLHKNDCMTLEHFSRFFHNTHRCHAAVTVCVQLGIFRCGTRWLDLAHRWRHCHPDLFVALVDARGCGCSWQDGWVQDVGSFYTKAASDFFGIRSTHFSKHFLFAGGAVGQASHLCAQW